MTYITGTVTPVPAANKDAFIAHARAVWPMFARHGALRQVEAWGEDIPHGQQTDFWRAIQAEDGEVPVFSFTVWPDRATCDAAWAKIMSEAQPELAAMEQMPYDGRRMFWGGFAPIVERGAAEGNWLQGFVLAVPAANKQSYIEMAEAALPMFEGHGATHQVECWGEDVPHGTLTDFYKAAQAQGDEVPLFSWIAWPDRATCDRAAQAMQAEHEAGQHQHAQMPFDGMRMFWGGFSIILDERA
ncbi:MAG: DUF1428 domain-containing protein [Paracoccus sp. (in: a-proteobacteria)]|nr:DUF1428 domain-containing protein [Paracoccus sp. (in: a-proteobacteria)]